MTLACTKFVLLLSLSNYFGCYGNLNFPLTYKAKICNFCRFIEDIEILFLHKCILSSPSCFRQLLSKSLYSFGCCSNVKGKFSKKKKKFVSEAVRRMKLKLCIHAYDISLYKVCVFHCHCPTTLVAMAT